MTTKKPEIFLFYFFHSQDNFLLGDFHYMCPKYLETGCATESTDIYGFGVVLCELLTGSPPYESSRDPPGIVEYLHKSMSSSRHLQEAVDPVAKWKKKSCTSFARVAIACVQFDPRDRPNIDSIIEDIQQILDAMKQYQYRQQNALILESESGDLNEMVCSDGGNVSKLSPEGDGSCNFNNTGGSVESQLSTTTVTSSQRVVPMPSSPSSSYDAVKKDLVVGNLIELEPDSVSVSTSYRKCPLSIFGRPIEQIGYSFRWGSLLASNPCLLCSCSNMTNDNSVYILDLWEMEKGRVVKFGASTTLKAASMNQNGVLIAAQVLLCLYMYNNE